MVQISLADLGLRAFDANGFTVSGALCYVYDAGTTTPVTTYSDNGLTTPQTFPVPANANGAFPEIYVPVGVYKVDLTDDEGASLPGFPKDYLPIPFSAYAVTARTREEVAARALQLQDGAIIWLGTLAFEVQDGATVISDIANVVPAGDVTPNHFAENTTPGTTDMSAAWQSAIDYAADQVGTGSGVAQNASAQVIGRPEEYYIGSTVKISSDQDAVQLFGGGARLVSAVSGPCLRIGDDALFGNTDGSDTAGTGTNYGSRVAGFTFATAATNTTDTIAIQAGKCPGLSIDNNVFFDFYISIDGHRFNGRSISDNNFYTNARTTPALTHVRLQGVYDSTNVYTPGGGVHIDRNEFWGYAGDFTMLPYCMLVKSVDGLYANSNHFVYYGTVGVEFSPDGGRRNNIITEVDFSAGNYWDACATGARNVNIAGIVRYAGTSGQANGQYKNIKFIGNTMRGAGTGAYGITVSVIDGGGFVAARGGVIGLKISENDIGQHTLTGITMSGADASRMPVVLPQISGNYFFEGRRGGAAGGTAYVSLESFGAVVNGNVFAEETNAPARAVLISGTSTTGGSFTFSGNDLSETTATTSPFSVPADTNIDGTLNNGVSSSINFRRTSDGRQECWGVATATFLNTSTLQVTVTFPLTFAASPTILTGSGGAGTATPAATEILAPKATAISTTQATFQVNRVVGGTNFVSGDTISVHFHAKGDFS